MSYEFLNQHFGSIVITLYLLYEIYQYYIYRTSSYYKQTHKSYYSVRLNRGRKGEYQIYRNLHHLEKHGAKLLFNLYIPDAYGGTTEIDMLVLARSGIYVIESKNYKGWIFGSEPQKMWTQVLYGKDRKLSRKEKFYNPIWQNRTHIRWLRMITGKGYKFHSLIVFSDRCTFKTRFNAGQDEHVTITSGVSRIIGSNPHNILSQQEIDRLYSRLYKYTQSDSKVRKQHIRNIKNKY